MDKIGGKLKFLYRKQSVIDPTLRRLLSNGLIQPYACAIWYAILNEKFVKKFQTIQNKCIRFCLNKKNRIYIFFYEPF